MDIFPLMCVADKVWITELTLIHKNIRSVRNSHVQVYRSIRHKIKILGQFVTCVLKCIGRSDVKHIMTSPINTVTSVLTASTDIITDITARPIKLSEMLAIMSVSTFCRHSIYLVLSSLYHLMCKIYIA